MSNGAPDPWFTPAMQAASTPPAYSPADGAGTTYNTPIPGAAGYMGAEAAANLAYKNALARLNQNRSSTLRQYGYTGNIDPKTGVLTGMAVDPNNPFGQYQQLRGNHADQAQAQEYAAESRGLGAGGGLAAQMEQKAHHTFGADDAAMGQALTGTLSDLQDQQDQAAYTRDMALWQAQQAAAEAAAAGGNFSPPDLTGVQDPGYGDTGTGAGKAGAANKIVKAARGRQVAARSRVGQLTGTRGAYGHGAKPKARAKAHVPVGQLTGSTPKPKRKVKK